MAFERPERRNRPVNGWSKSLVRRFGGRNLASVLTRRNALLVFVLFVSGLTAILASVAIRPADAAESPTCDAGPVTNVRLTIDGTTYHRPDSRIDGQPRTTSVGPFRVAADIDATVARIDVVYWTQSNQRVGITAMPIAGRVATGTIPPFSVTARDDIAFFYVQAFDVMDHLFWIDQLRPACHSASGSPYHFVINTLLPPEPDEDEGLSFTAHPICIENPIVQTDPTAAALQVGDEFATEDGVRYMIMTGEASCSFNCDSGADANCDDVLGDYCAVELNLQRVQDVGICLAALSPTSQAAVPSDAAPGSPPAAGRVGGLAYTGAGTGLLALAIGLIGTGAAAMGWSTRHQPSNSTAAARSCSASRPLSASDLRPSVSYRGILSKNPSEPT